MNIQAPTRFILAGLCALGLGGCASLDNRDATPCQYAATCYIAPLKS